MNRISPQKRVKKLARVLQHLFRMLEATDFPVSSFPRSGLMLPLRAASLLVKNCPASHQSGVFLCAVALLYELALDPESKHPMLR